MKKLRTKKPPIPFPPPAPRPPPADPDGEWAALTLPPVPRLRPLGSATTARLRAATIWWRPRRLP
jgi:hypothetical protein